MKERPILMSAPMVRAILDGTKTQTRRAVAFPRKREAFVIQEDDRGLWPYQSDDGESTICDDGCEHPYASPYGVPGDHLYVKEAWRTIGALDHLPPSEVWIDAPIEYEADGKQSFAGRYRHARFMMRWMSRITLEVTDVRVERLQDISEADALAEGAPPSHRSIDVISRQYGYEDFSRSWYAQLWDQINGPGSWAANPWVWAITFRRIDSDAGRKG